MIYKDLQYKDPPEDGLDEFDCPGNNCGADVHEGMSNCLECGYDIANFLNDLKDGRLP